MMQSGQSTPRASSGSAFAAGASPLSASNVASGEGGGIFGSHGANGSGVVCDGNATLMTTMRGMASTGNLPAGGGALSMAPPQHIPGPSVVQAGLYGNQRIPACIPQYQHLLGLKGNNSAASSAGVGTSGAALAPHIQSQLLALQQQQLQQQLQQLQQRDKMAAAAAAVGSRNALIMQSGASLIGLNGLPINPGFDNLCSTQPASTISLANFPRTQLPASQLLPMRVIGNQVEVYGPAVAERFLGDSGSILLFLKGKQIKHTSFFDNSEQWQNTCHMLLECGEMPQDASLPVMVHDGRVLFSGPESILRYLSKKLGQYGVDHMKDAAADTVFVEAQNWSNGLQIAIRAAATSRDVEDFKDYLLNREVWYRQFESLLAFFLSKFKRDPLQDEGSNGFGTNNNVECFFTGCVDTCCDYFIFSLLVDDQRIIEFLGEQESGSRINYFDACPNLKRLHDTLASFPLIREYLCPNNRDVDRKDIQPAHTPGDRPGLYQTQQSNANCTLDFSDSSSLQQSHQGAIWSHNAHLLQQQDSQQPPQLQHQMYQSLQSQASLPFTMSNVNVTGGATGAMMYGAPPSQLGVTGGPGACINSDYLSRSLGSINRIQSTGTVPSYLMMPQAQSSGSTALLPSQGQYVGMSSGSAATAVLGGTTPPTLGVVGLGSAAASGVQVGPVSYHHTTGAGNGANKMETITSSGSGSQHEDLEPQ